MAPMMEGNHEVSLLLAWKSRCRSVKKTPMQKDGIMGPVKSWCLPKWKRDLSGDFYG
ncbi:rCG35375 [Rattus norvegicus]|uniref:RCG35375 n=1 Tax=Rattus norvegicus TaxID=10116 RepID=A6HKN0_RAT|nr:rCG35375 [Rattus norvegicus]